MQWYSLGSNTSAYISCGWYLTFLEGMGHQQNALLLLDLDCFRLVQLGRAEFVPLVLGLLLVF